MPAASSGVIGRTWATVPSRSTTSASHSTGSAGGLRRHPLDGARVVGAVVADAVAGALGSVIEVAIEVLPTHHGLIVSRRADRPAEDATLASWSSPRSSAAAAWSVATTPTGPCPARSSSAASTTPSAPRAPASARAGTSSSSRPARSARRSGRPRPPRMRPRTRGSAAYGRRRCSCCASPTRTPTSSATPRPTRAGPTGTRSAGRCPTGTSTPAWPRCSILLTATDEGLGSLFFGVPPERHDAVHDAFDDPCRPHASSGVVSLGYAVPGPRSPSLRRHRRTGHEVAHWGRFGVAGEGAR